MPQAGGGVHREARKSIGQKYFLSLHLDGDLGFRQLKLKVDPVKKARGSLRNERKGLQMELF